MWRLKPSTGSVLYFSLRYPMLFNTIAVILAYMPRNGRKNPIVSSQQVDICPVPACMLTVGFPLRSGYFALVRELVMVADDCGYGRHDSCSVILRLEMAGDALILISSAGM